MKAELQKNEIDGIEMYALLKKNKKLYRWTGNYYCAEPMPTTFAVGDIPEIPWMDETSFKQMVNAKVLSDTDKAGFYYLLK